MQIELVDLVLGVGTSMAMMSACASETVSKVTKAGNYCLILYFNILYKALRKTDVQLLEPFSQLVVSFYFIFYLG